MKREGERERDSRKSGECEKEKVIGKDQKEEIVYKE